jgi:hypothetical protein
MELTDLQFSILDSLYFPEPFENVMAEVGEPRQIVLAELRELIDKTLVQVMRWDDTAQDYLPSPHLDADRLNEFRFLATRKGLLAHNGRSQR